MCAVKAIEAVNRKGMSKLGEWGIVEEGEEFMDVELGELDGMTDEDWKTVGERGNKRGGERWYFFFIYLTLDYLAVEA